MNKDCKRMQEDLIDIFYEEKQMNNEIETHITCCQECKSFWDSLHCLETDLSAFDTKVDADIGAIQEAFKTAGERQKTQKARTDYLVFLGAVFAIMSVVVGIAAMGYGMAVIICQISVAVLTSILLPLLYLIKLTREES